MAIEEKQQKSKILQGYTKLMKNRVYIIMCGACGFERTVRGRPKACEKCKKPLHLYNYLI